jgi:hypothetical protein
MAASSFPEMPVTSYCTTWSYNPKDHNMRIKCFTASVSSETPACGCGFDMNDQGIRVAVMCQLWPVPGSLKCATASVVRRWSVAKVVSSKTRKDRARPALFVVVVLFYVFLVLFYVFLVLFYVFFVLFYVLFVL